MKKIYGLIMMGTLVSCGPREAMTIDGGSELITMVGRTDRSEVNAPKQWAAGGYFTFGFEGNECVIEMNDEQPNGETRNIIEVAVDDNQSVAYRMSGIRNVIIIGDESKAEQLKDSLTNVISYPINNGAGKHHVTICRDSETAMGYTQLVSVKADNIFKWSPDNGLKIEFIGNSITCGAESDTTMKAREEYKWGDWHRAYVGYGPRTARALNAQWSLVSVSGIGLIRSCCDMGITMPQVYDKIILRDNKLSYDYAYQPDIICSCLGQNDGIQDSTAFCSAYVDFIKDVKAKNPQAKKIVMLSSPMDHGELNDWLCRMIKSIVDQLGNEGIDNVTYYFYTKAWNGGGVDHPSEAEHAEIAEELTNYLKTIL